MPDHERAQPASSWHRWTAQRAGGEDAANPLFQPATPTAADEIDEDQFGDGDVGVDEFEVDEDHFADGDLGDDELSELLPAVPLLPSIAGRVDALDGQLRAISMRLDVLGSAVAALRSSLGDRIDAYAEAAASATRQSDDALEEHRRTTQRVTADLRTGIGHHEEALRRVAGLLEEVAADVSSLVDAVADLPHRAADPRPAPAGPPPPPPEPPDLAPVEEAIDDLGARLEARLDAMLAAATAAPVPVPSHPAPVPAVADLTLVEKALGQIRAMVEVIVDTMPASAEGTGTDLAERVAEAVAARLDHDALAEQIAEKLRLHFEVVADDDGP